MRKISTWCSTPLIDWLIDWRLAFALLEIADAINQSINQCTDWLQKYDWLIDWSICKLFGNHYQVTPKDALWLICWLIHWLIDRLIEDWRWSDYKFADLWWSIDLIVNMSDKFTKILCSDRVIGCSINQSAEQSHKIDRRAWYSCHPLIGQLVDQFNGWLVWWLGWLVDQKSKWVETTDSSDQSVKQSIDWLIGLVPCYTSFHQNHLA